MENINNIPFSFDRNTSKWIAQLGTSHTESSFADGITLSNVIINNTLESKVVDNFSARIPYTTIDGDISYIDYEVPEDERENFIGILQLSNRTLPDQNLFYQVKYTLERDSYLNYNKFEIKQVTPATIENGKYKGKKILLYALYFKSNEDDLKNVYILDQNTYNEVNDGVYPIYTLQAQNTPDSIVSELYYRNKANHVYADYDVHKLSTKDLNIEDYVPPINISEEEALNWDAVHIKGTNKEQAMKSVRGLQEKLAEMGIEDPLVGNSAYQIVKVGGKDCYVPKWNPYPCTTLNKFISEIDDTNHIHNIQIQEHWVITAIESTSGSRKVHLDLPIFKDITGKRPMLPKEEQINSDKIVTLLNIKASIQIEDIDNKSSLSDAYYNMKAGYNSKTSLIDMGYYQSVVAVAPKWNLQFLTSDFWKHGQAGIIDIADDIYPTYWYGKQHPFEFEFIVVNDPSVHKIFTNLEIVANKAKPESFHYEIVGESYDFAKDKVNMYFRQEAMKALWQYNGADISYDRNFLKVQPKQQNKSADFPHRYYTRQDTINDVEDYYIHVSYPNGYDYRHLSGAEIVYYPNRQEFRVQNHAMAVDLDDPKLEGSRSIIAANCKYLEDRWKVTINPITIVYKNEYQQKGSGNLFSDINSTWPYAQGNYQKLPSLPIYNSPIPDKVLESGNIDFPGNDLEHPEWGEDNALYNLYDLSNYNQKGGWKPLDLTNWLNDVNIYKYNFGEAQNRKEIDIKDKFLKVRIRYSGEELAIIDFVKTIYRVSYS